MAINKALLYYYEAWIVMCGAGDVMIPMWISLTSTVILRVPTAYGIANTLVYYKKGNWSNKSITSVQSEM